VRIHDAELNILKSTASLSTKYLGWCYKPTEVASIPLGISNFSGKDSAIVLKTIFFLDKLTEVLPEKPDASSAIVVVLSACETKCWR
jgi:hypothetical protein